jgi:hypothetical protein
MVLPVQDFAWIFSAGFFEVDVPMGVPWPSQTIPGLSLKLRVIVLQEASFTWSVGSGTPR